MKNPIFDKVNYNHLSLMALTSVHHVYGAVIYDTPWRLHVLFFSIPVIIVGVLFIYFDKHRNIYSRGIFFWPYWMIILVISILMFGCFEGIYNHLLKNILYFSGMEKGHLLKMFPPPTYEMPDDFIFELTGVLQAVVAFVLIYFFIPLTRKRISGKTGQ